jgi:hypothetical protein
MNLLKLPAEMQVFLLDLEDAKEVRKYSERKLRDNHGQDKLHQSLSDIDLLSGNSGIRHLRDKRLGNGLCRRDPDFRIDYDYSR